MYKLSDAEKEVMEVLWEFSEPVQTKDLLDMMQEKGRNWKRQTLNTLLSRLEEKGIVSRKRAYVKAVFSKEELLQKQTQEIVDNFYGGKLGNFCAAFIGNTEIEPEDVERLNALIDELRNK